MKTSESLAYRNHEGIQRKVSDCILSVNNDVYWIWSNYLEQNLVYKTKGRENALLAAIDSLLFTIQLRDQRIAALQRVVNLAERFAEEAFPSNEE